MSEGGGSGGGGVLGNEEGEELLHRLGVLVAVYFVAYEWVIMGAITIRKSI